jgi:hypothetical protein
MRRAALGLLCVAACAPAPAGYDDDRIRREDLGQAAALARVNAIRASAGQSRIEAAPKVHLAAGRHAAYLVENDYEYDSLWPHEEVPWLLGYSGQWPGDRILAAGSLADSWGEIVHGLGEPLAAVDGWLGTPYHRITMLAPDTSALGHASIRARGAAADVMNFLGTPGANADRIALWPHPDATDVPHSFDGRERPEPPPPPNGWPSGYPVSAGFGSGSEVRLLHSRLRAGGAELPHVAIDRTNDAQLEDEVVIYSHEPLPPLTRIDVELDLATATGPVSRRWAFTTARTPN